MLGACLKQREKEHGGERKLVSDSFKIRGRALEVKRHNAHLNVVSSECLHDPFGKSSNANVRPGVSRSVVTGKKNLQLFPWYVFRIAHARQHTRPPSKCRYYSHDNGNDFVHQNTSHQRLVSILPNTCLLLMKMTYNKKVRTMLKRVYQFWNEPSLVLATFMKARREEFA